MKNKIEIQILTPATKEQLMQIRDEIRKVEGLESFDLRIPPAPLAPGKMDGGLLALGALVLEAAISGVTHFTAEKTTEYYGDQIAGAVRRVMGMNKRKPRQPLEAMSPEPPTAETEDWKIAISDTNNGRKTVTYYDENGSSSLYSNREYSIDPEYTYAILIGTSEYDDKASFSAIPPVAGNMDAMYRVLSDKTLVGLPYENISRLYNESCINIKEELRNITKTDGIKTLIIYYAGHGQNVGNNQLSLIAKDTRAIDEELHNDIPYSFIERMMNTSQADQKIIFIDACHSGLAAQGNNNSFDFEPVLGTFTLASTSADDSSYFKRDAANTYFTNYLAEAFREGITNSNTMLSLNDLYNYTSQKLSKIRLPVPVCKSQFKNISADKFYISPNPSFSLEARLGLPKQLYLQGKYEEARREYILLEKEYPDNQALRNEHIEFERNLEFNRLVKEGDIFFYKERKYRAAQMKYREALTVRDDESVRDKIADCENHILDDSQSEKNDQRQEQKRQEEKKEWQQKYEKPKPVPLPDPVPDERRKKRTQIILGLIAIAILSVLYLFITHHGWIQVQDRDGSYFKYKGDTKTVNNGDTKTEIPDGEGEAHFRNGAIYKGEWLNSRLDGKGVMTWDNGDKYEGYFKNGYLDGDGKYTYKDGTVYEGNWVAGSLQGSVKASFSNGNKYEGQWLNNTENGYGTFTWQDGNSYTGNFKNGFREGTGTLIWKNGDIYNCPGCRKYYGDWRRDLKQGYGICYGPGGNIIYQGYFSNDKPVSTYPSEQ